MKANLFFCGVAAVAVMAVAAVTVVLSVSGCVGKQAEPAEELVAWIESPATYTFRREGNRWVSDGPLYGKARVLHYDVELGLREDGTVVWRFRDGGE